MEITLEQSAEIKKLLTKCKLWQKKEQIVKDFSLDSHEQIGKLTGEEAERLKVYLVELEEKGNKMRRKLLSIGYQMNFDAPISAAQKNMDPKDINFKNVNAWCESDKSMHKKSLNRLNPFELTETVTQFENVLKSYKTERQKVAHARR